MLKNTMQIAAVLVSGLVVTASSVAMASAKSPSAEGGGSTTVHACVAKADRFVTNYYGRKIIVIPHGTARIVHKAKACKSWESATSWKSGGAGQKGADGAKGRTGAAGAAGANGG